MRGKATLSGLALISALLFGFMDRAALILDLNDIPREVISILQGVVVLAVVVAYEIVNQMIERREVKAAAEAMREDTDDEEVAA